MSVTAFAVALALAGSVPAAAQFQPAPDRPAGERYNIEAAASFWNATPTLIVSSESLGIPGDDVDLVADLGIEKKRINELRVVLRPGTKHKFRINYLPIKYEASSTVQREFTFNGLRYRVGIPVSTTADLTTFRFGYEYDFLYRDWGFVGVLFDVKYTDVEVTLDSPIGSEFTAQVAPIPTIGVVVRGYLVPSVSITGEVSFFKVPDSLSEQFNGGGRYLDYDFYGTFNFNRYIGAQVGLRSVDVEYFKDLDSGNLNFKGLYFGGVIRY
jgi:hypothetical protein